MLAGEPSAGVVVAALSLPPLGAPEVALSTRGCSGLDQETGSAGYPAARAPGATSDPNALAPSEEVREDLRRSASCAEES